MNELDCRAIEERLPWFLHGGLAPKEQEAMSRHFEACGLCRAALAATREASALFAAHLPVETIVDYALGLELGAPGREVIELHFAHCPDCREELAAVSAPAPEEKAAEDRATESIGASIGSRRSRRWAPGLALAASVAIASGLAVWIAMRERIPPAGGRVAVVEIAPEEARSRGMPEMAAMPGTFATAAADGPPTMGAGLATTILLVTDRAESFDEARARIEPAAGGDPVVEERGLLPVLGGGFALHLRAGALVPGDYRIVLDGRLGADWSPLGRFPLIVGP